MSFRLTDKSLRYLHLRKIGWMVLILFLGAGRHVEFGLVKKTR